MLPLWRPVVGWSRLWESKPVWTSKWLWPDTEKQVIFVLLVHNFYIFLIDSWHVRLWTKVCSVLQPFSLSWSSRWTISQSWGLVHTVSRNMDSPAPISFVHNIMHSLYFSVVRFQSKSRDVSELSSPTGYTGWPFLQIRWNVMFLYYVECAVLPGLVRTADQTSKVSRIGEIWHACRVQKRHKPARACITESRWTRAIDLWVSQMLPERRGRDRFSLCKNLSIVRWVYLSW